MLSRRKSPPNLKTAMWGKAETGKSKIEYFKHPPFARLENIKRL